jgi:hypothetical protein
MTAQPEDWQAEWPEAIEGLRLATAAVDRTSTMANPVEALADVRDVLADLKAIESLLESAAVKVIGRERYEGVGFVAEVKVGSQRKQWDHEGLLTRYIARRLGKRQETTDTPPTPFDVAQWIAEGAAFGYWRVGVLKALGIRVDDFCHTDPPLKRVVITRST